MIHRSINVLVVEDGDIALIFQKYIKRMFEDHIEANVRVCRTFEGIADAIDKERPQVMLLDLGLDQYGPDEIIQVIPSFARLNDVIVCSNREEQDIFARAILAGASDYVIKGELFKNEDYSYETMKDKLRSRLQAGYYRNMKKRGLIWTQQYETGAKITLPSAQV